MDFHLLNILLVEDDISLGEDLSNLLKSCGHNVMHCADGDEAFEAFCNGRFNFCIFDLMLPGIDGFTLTERVRRRDKRIPVVIISRRNHKDDKQKAFDLEVDDYLVKPFEKDELLWRVRAVTRRMQPAGNAEDVLEPIQIGRYSFNLTHQTLKNGTSIQRLTRRECEVLRMLCNRKNQLVRREEILMQLWGDVDYFHGRSLDVFISKLRGYLKNDSQLKINNIPTVGYVLREDD
jgi:DNA-binding response OmpR family regulator